MKELNKRIRAFQWDLLKLFFKTIGVTVVSSIMIGVLCFHAGLFDTSAPQVMGMLNGIFIFLGFLRPRTQAIVGKHQPLIVEEAKRVQKEREEKLNEDKKD